MTARFALCIAVDGLRASALGCYGNAWYPTPVIDELAARALVLDALWCHGPELADFYGAMWPPNWAELLGGGVARSLITDDPQVARYAEAAGFDDVLAWEADGPAASEKGLSGGMESAFALAAERLGMLIHGDSASAPAPARLVWLHTRGLRGPWDAPLECRAQLLDEGDPPPPEFVAPPAAVPVTDHDELLQYRVAYAAQVLALDAHLGGLVAALDELGLRQRALVLLVGCRGFALGEHGAVGGEVRALFGELLHVPCLVSTPETTPAPPRSSRLLQPADLPSLLGDWFGGRNGLPIGELDDGPPAREFVAAAGFQGERAVRTAEWMLRQPAEAPAECENVSQRPAAELYVKPDDRWEANDIASRRPEALDELLAILARDAPSMRGPGGPG